MILMINKQVVLEESMDTLKNQIRNNNLGAFDRDSLAIANGYNIKNAAARQNFNDHPGQYFTNPYIKGPLRHGVSELAGATTNGIYGLVKNSDAPDTQNINNFQKGFSRIKGPLNREVIANERDNALAGEAIGKNQQNNYLSYVANPFVRGPMTAGYLKDAADQIEAKKLKYNVDGGNSNQNADNKKDLAVRNYLRKQAGV